MNFVLRYPGSAMLYITVVIITTFLAKMGKRKNNKKLSIFLIILILTLYSGVRAESVGTDTLNYVTHINLWQTIESYIRYPTEPGLRIISILSSYISNNISTVLIIIALIINTLIILRLWSYRDKLSFTTSIFIYSASYYIMTFSGIRQWIAIAIVFYASKYILEKSFIKYIFLILLATLFHNTAIIAIGIPIIDIFSSKYKYHKKSLLISLIIFPLIIFSVLFLAEYNFQLISQYSNYIENITLQSGSGITLWIRIIIGLLIKFTINKDTFSSLDEYLFFKRTYNVYFVGLIIIIPGYYLANINRLALYYTIYELIIFGIVSKNRKKGKLYFVFILILAYTVLMFIIGLMSSGFGHMPYIPFWEESLFMTM